MSLEPKKISVLTEDQRLASLVALRGYTSYVAVLTQAGTDAPVVSILENTIGYLVWSRIDAGVYLAVLAGAFTIGKTCVFTPSLEISGEVVTIAGNPTINNITFTSSIGGVYGDDFLFNASVEIRVYN